MVDVASRTTHVLDPLSVEEIAEAVRIVRASGDGTDRYLYSSVELLEPPKAVVLATESGSPNGHLDRIAKAVIIDQVERRSLEYLISLTSGRVLDRSSSLGGATAFHDAGDFQRRNRDSPA